MSKPFWSRGVQPTRPVTAPPPPNPNVLDLSFARMVEELGRYKLLEEQARAALKVYEADKTFNSTSLVMADKLYTGLSALEGRGS